MSLKTKDLLYAWSTFFEAHAYSVQRVEEQISEEATLSLHEYDLLLTLKRAPQMRLRFSELTSESVFTKSGITRIAKRMEQREFIERVACKEDRRGAYAVLTKAGDTALEQTWKLYSRAVLDIFEPALSQAEAQELSRLLEKVIEQLRPPKLVGISS